MDLILVGCEYAGKTTLSEAINRWGEDLIGGPWGAHDHFTIPHIAHSELTEEEQGMVMALTPRLKEMFQRYLIEYHLQPSMWDKGKWPHMAAIGFHIEEAVYAPLYHGYGGNGEYAERSRYARHIEERLLTLSPGFVLVLVKASPEVIARRMKSNPHKNSPLRERDIEHVLRTFEYEYDESLIKNKLTLDTSATTVEETLAEFVERVEPYITDADRLRILVQKAKKRGRWL